MSQIGTVIVQTPTPATTSTPYNTANSFLAGLADWGPVATPVTIQSLAGTQAIVGPRSGTNTTVYDSLDVFFREGAPNATALFSRVAGPSASAASLTLNDSNGSASLLVQAVYVGNYGNAIQLSVSNVGLSYTVTLTDTFGNTLAISPALTSRAAAQAWATTTAYVKITPYAGSTWPTSSNPTSMSGGTDDRAHAGLVQYQTAINSFPITLGPGQVWVPGVTNTAVPGIWQAIGSHCLANNRVGICDMDDGSAASVQISSVGTTFNNAAVGPLAFWAGNLTAPGIAPATTRSIPPSAVVAGLCTQVDSTGNPNQAAAGSNFPMRFCTGSFTLVTGATETYSPSDVNALNSAGVNAFASRFGVFENFGFAAALLPTVDAIYWQFNHCRLRMAILAQSQVIAEPFLFSQLDGQGADIILFTTALQNMLNRFWQLGALYGATALAAYSVNTGPAVNTPASLQAGQLNAVISVKMSPFAQLIDIVFNSIPITASVPPGSTTSASTSTAGFAGSSGVSQP